MLSDFLGMLHFINGNSLELLSVFFSPFPLDVLPHVLNRSLHLISDRIVQHSQKSRACQDSPSLTARLLKLAFKLIEKFLSGIEKNNPQLVL
jgi:hypothetical protein